MYVQVCVTARRSPNQRCVRKYGALGGLPSFPARRSADLGADRDGRVRGFPRAPAGAVTNRRARAGRDRKSTRLNSSHVRNSYAVFCLKKKTTTSLTTPADPGAIEPACALLKIEKLSQIVA